MLETLICISEFGTKLVAGLSGLIFAIIIVVCVYFGKNKKSKPSYPDTKIGKQDQNADDGKRKKSKKSKAKDTDAENSDNANAQTNTDTKSVETTKNTDTADTENK